MYILNFLELYHVLLPYVFGSFLQASADTCRIYLFSACIPTPKAPVKINSERSGHEEGRFTKQNGSPLNKFGSDLSHFPMNGVMCRALRRMKSSHVQSLKYKIWTMGNFRANIICRYSILQDKMEIY